MEARIRSWAGRFAAVVIGCACAVAVAAQEQGAEELRKLEGGWMVVAAEQRGRPLDAIRGGGLVIEGNTFLLKTAAGNEFKGELKVDASKSPKQLDFVHATGGVVWQAIYTVDEEMFRINYVEVGEKNRRPTLFATSSDSGGTVIVMNRLTKR